MVSNMVLAMREPRWRTRKRSTGPAAAHCSGKSMRPKARWRASSWRWYFETALIIGSVSGCSLASFCRRSGTSSPLSTSRQKSDGMPVRNGITACMAKRPIGLSSGFLAWGLTCSRSLTKRREWRGSSPISCSREVKRGAGEDVHAESSHQDGLEADAGVHDGGELLPGEGALLLVGQRVEELREVGQGDEFVGEDLAVADGA